MERELAIRLRGVVKRYGPITAVNELDLDVPVGTCVGLLGPNGGSHNSSKNSFQKELPEDRVGFRTCRSHRRCIASLFH